MGNLKHREQLEVLRARIAGIERRPLLATNAALTATDPLSAPPGLVQEVFTDERRNAGLALGFALAQARSLRNTTRPGVIYLQIPSQSQELGLPYGPGLHGFGFDPEALVLVRPANMVELLWAAEEALACRAVAAVIVEVAGQPKILDFTASRRLSLRAAASGASIFLLRYGLWREASAAQMRWHLSPALSAERPFDARAPGQPRWHARLEKSVLAYRQNQQWLLEWSSNGFSPASDIHPRPDWPSYGSALSRPLPAPLADRLSQTA